MLWGAAAVQNPKAGLKSQQVELRSSPRDIQPLGRREQEMGRAVAFFQVVVAVDLDDRPRRRSCGIAGAGPGARHRCPPLPSRANRAGRYAVSARQRCGVLVRPVRTEQGRLSASIALDCLGAPGHLGGSRSQTAGALTCGTATSMPTSSCPGSDGSTSSQPTATPSLRPPPCTTSARR